MAKTVTQFQSTKTPPTKTPDKQAEVLPPIKRSTRGLTELMFSEMDLIRAGNSNSTRANAMGRMGTVIIETIRLEMEIERHAEKIKTPQNPNAEGPTDKELD